MKLMESVAEMEKKNYRKNKKGLKTVPMECNGSPPPSIFPQSDPMVFNLSRCFSGGQLAPFFPHHPST